MNTLKKPLRLHGDFILDADSKLVGCEYAEQMVLEMNAHNDLLAACEAMLDGLDDYWIASDHGNRVFKMAQAAIAKARPEPAKEQA